MLHTIIFDLDGTLIDTMDLIVASWQHCTAVHCGASISREAVLPTIGLPLVPALEAYAPGKGELLYATYQEHNHAWHDRLAHLVPGTREMLARLQTAGIALGLVSSKRHGILEMGLNLHALGPYFGAVIGLEDTARHKPFPDPLLCALERLGRAPDPQHVAYVGDAAGDMAAALAAGVRPIGVPWGATPTAELQAAGANPLLAGWDDLIALAEAPA
jgi:pyrophosphatase PpaX